MIIHFQQRLGADPVAELEAAGVRIFGYVPDNSVIASVPVGFVPSPDVGIDWVGPLEGFFPG